MARSRRRGEALAEADDGIDKGATQSDLPGTEGGSWHRVASRAGRWRLLGGLGGALCVLLVAWIWSSRSVGPEGEDETVEPRPLVWAEEERVEYTGCAEVWLEVTPRCMVEPGIPLHLWVRHHDPEMVTVRVDGEATPVQKYSVEGFEGVGLEIVLPDGAHELTVEVLEPRARWSLALGSTSRDSEPPTGTRSSREVDEALGGAFMAGLAGEYSKALQLLADVEALASRYPKGAAELATYRGVVYWRQGRFHDAATSLRDGVAFGVRLRDPWLIMDALPTYANVIAELGYVDAAAQWADRALVIARDHPEVFKCVDMGKLLATVGYNRLLLAQAKPRGRVSGAVPLLEEALELLGPAGRCPQPELVPAVQLSLANAHLAGEEPAKAMALWDDSIWSRAATSDHRVRLADADFRIRQALGWPEGRGAEVLARLEKEAKSAGSPEGRWRLELRRGDFLAHQGREEEAVSAYRRAEDEAQAIAGLAAVGVGRETSVSLHGQSTERLIRLLDGLGRPEQALCAARVAQARRIQAVDRGTATPEQRQALDEALDDYGRSRRALDEASVEGRSLPRRDEAALQVAMREEQQRLSQVVNEILAARSTWRATCEELVPRGAGELLLGLYPASGGWFVFVQDEAGTEVGWHEGELDEAALGGVLSELGDRLGAAKRMRVLASGRAQEVDVHLLEWEGRRLLERVPVVYGAELPRRDGSDRREGGFWALVVGDPTETLAEARKEVERAREHLHGEGWSVDMPSPEEAERQRIIEGLGRASLFYYAGHAEHDVDDGKGWGLPPYAGGTQAWPARMRLRPPTVLEIQDVLMLDKAPRYVALLGCKTGVPGGTGGGMSLALAFLVAGAEQVVATPVETEDRVGLVTGVGVLGGVSRHRVDLAEGLRSVQAEMLRRGESVGRYRVWVR